MGDLLIGVWNGNEFGFLACGVTVGAMVMRGK